MTTWGKRKLSDSRIREISQRARQTAKGTRSKIFKDMAIEYNCSVSTIYRIYSCVLTPGDIDKCRT